MLHKLEVGWEGGWARGLKQVGEEADCSKSMKSQHRVFLAKSSLAVKTMGSGVRLWGSFQRQLVKLLTTWGSSAPLAVVMSLLMLTVTLSVLAGRERSLPLSRWLPLQLSL